MNPGWGQAPRVPEAPTRDLARHHEQAPPGPHQTRLHAVGNQTRLTNYVETRTGQAPQPLTKTTYEGVCFATRRSTAALCARSSANEGAQIVDTLRRVVCKHARSRRKGAGRAGQTLLVHCGRLSMEKYAYRSIDTVALLRDWGVDARLIVIGEGPMRARLERQAARLPVDFTGYIGCRDTVATILATADVALAPGPHETFGLAALEALACGTPAVVSRTSALAEILTAKSRGGRRQPPGRDRARRDRGHQPTGTPAPLRRPPSSRTVHLAAGGQRHAGSSGCGIGGAREGYVVVTGRRHVAPPRIL
jgi:Glycosyl transferases group 1